LHEQTVLAVLPEKHAQGKAISLIIPGQPSASSGNCGAVLPHLRARSPGCQEDIPNHRFHGIPRVAWAGIEACWPPYFLGAGAASKRVSASRRKPALSASLAHLGFAIASRSRARVACACSFWPNWYWAIARKARSPGTESLLSVALSCSARVSV